MMEAAVENYAYHHRARLLAGRILCDGGQAVY